MGLDTTATPEQLKQLSDGELLDVIYELASYEESPDSEVLKAIRDVLKNAITAGDN